MSLESSEEKMAWCQNSRRWLVFMDLAMRYPESCPHDGQCAKGYCGYFEERKPSKYVLRKLGVLQSFTGKENRTREDMINATLKINEELGVNLLPFKCKQVRGAREVS